MVVGQKVWPDRLVKSSNRARESLSEYLSPVMARELVMRRNPAWVSEQVAKESVALAVNHLRALDCSVCMGQSRGMSTFVSSR